MNKLNDTDFGTPERESETQITLEIGDVHAIDFQRDLRF